MRNSIKRILSCIITICLTVALLGKLTDLMERKSSDEKYADFFENPECEVFFMGTSHVINGVFPMELWDDYGIVSYNFGGHSNQMATTYWTMENALDYATPKVVVIDCFSFSSNWKCSDKFSFLHQSFDAFPTSITKIKAIWDLLDDPYLEEAIANGKTRKSDEPRTKIGLLWDYSVYHSRWKELSQNDFEPKKNLEKGAESRIGVVRGKLEKIDPSEKTGLGTVGEEYLRKAIEDCKDRGIEVLLTYLPFPANEQQQREANYIYDLAKEYDVNYINFLDMELINYQTDCYDENHHLNPSGARKVTDYLGKYLVENYDIKDNRGNSDYDFWYEDYREYENLKDSNLCKQTSIVNYLMLLSNEKADIVLDIRNKDLFKNAWIMDLLANIGVNTNQLNENTDFIIVKKNNNSRSVVILDNFRENGCVADTDIGKVQLLYDTEGEQQGHFELCVDGNRYMEGNAKDDTSLQVTVTRDGKVSDRVRFIYTVNPETTIVNVSETKRD